MEFKHLMGHLKKSHKTLLLSGCNKPFACEACGKKFIMEVKLEFHLKKCKKAKLGAMTKIDDAKDNIGIKF